MSKPIPKIYADNKISALLSDYLQLNSLTDICDVAVCDNSKEIIISHNNKKNIYALPVRLGKIIDQLNTYKNINSKEEVIILARGSLDINQGVFTKGADNKISLTEKEVAIISFLYTNKGKIISREELLSSVWDYADNVETHTLETHIYRLRQKIEDNPSNPDIIITSDDGYKIN